MPWKGRRLALASAFGAALWITPAAATSIRDLAQSDQASLIAHVAGSLEGLATGFKLTGNKQAYDCIHLWSKVPAHGDSKAFTDILTRIGDELARLKGPYAHPPSYEDVLAAAVRRQCDTTLPSTP